MKWIDKSSVSMNKPGKPGDQDSLRLHVFMARCGVGSRRHCEELIKEGRVAVNGEKVTLLGVKVRESDRIELDGKMLSPVKEKFYIALHKPPGYLCSNYDKLDRPLALELIRFPLPTRLFHVGRLDFLSSGLIFYTNDGEFAQSVSHPSGQIQKVYKVHTFETVTEEALGQYKKGVEIEGQKYRLHSYRRIGDRMCLVTLVEGKNREIRKVLTYLGYRIKWIHRTRIGIVSIRGIEPGAWRFLTHDECEWFISLKKPKFKQ